MELLSIEGIDRGWDDLVWKSRGGTIFHTLRFLSYHEPSRFDFVNLAVIDDDGLVCVVPGGRLQTEGMTVLRSPVGASFGGFVFRPDADLKDIWASVDFFGARVRDMGFDGIDMVMPPLCYSDPQEQGLDFVMASLGYVPGLHEATMVVGLDATSDRDVDAALLRNLRKAGRAGVTVSTGGDIEAFHDVLTRNLAAKEASPTHTKEDLTSLFDLFPDRFILFEARFDEKVAGGCLVVLCNAVTALAFYICDDPAMRHLRVADSLVYHSSRWLREIGYKYLDLGTVSIGGRVNWGLVRFKSKFGARPYLREHYLKDLRG